MMAFLNITFTSPNVFSLQQHRSLGGIRIVCHLLHNQSERKKTHIPDSKVHGANMGPIWVLPAPVGSHIGPMNLAIRDSYPIVLVDSSRYYNFNFKITNVSTRSSSFSSSNIRLCNPMNLDTSDKNFITCINDNPRYLVCFFLISRNVRNVFNRLAPGCANYNNYKESQLQAIFMAFIYNICHAWKTWIPCRWKQCSKLYTVMSKRQNATDLPNHIELIQVGIA